MNDYSSLLKINFLFIILSFSSQDCLSQVGRLALSPLQTINQNIAKTDITITYSRPAIRGRQIFGGLVPYGKLWRTGANRSTKISFTEDVYLDTTRVAKGTYALYTLPNKDSWQIYLYTELDNWDVPEDWNTDKIAAQINVPVNKSQWQRSTLTLSIDEISNENFTLSIFWDKTHIKIPFRLSTEEHMSNVISEVLFGPQASDYFLSAQYRFEAGNNHVEALEWINKAIEIRDPSQNAFWDYSLKSKILIALERHNEVKVIAQKGLELAKNRNSEYGIRELKEILTKY